MGGTANAVQGWAGEAEDVILKPEETGGFVKDMSSQFLGRAMQTVT